MTDDRSRELHAGGFEELEYLSTAGLKAVVRWLKRRDQEATLAAGEAAQNVANPLYLETQIAFGSEARAVRRLAGDVEGLIVAREEAEQEELMGEVAQGKEKKVNYGNE